MSAGIWNTIMRAGQTLTNGLDILITNLFIGGTEMGYVSTSKTIVVAINTLYETISAVFTPSLTISYAKEDKKELLEDLTSAMKMTGFLPIYRFALLWRLVCLFIHCGYRGRTLPRIIP